MDQHVLQFDQLAQVSVNLKLAPAKGLANISTGEPVFGTVQVLFTATLFDEAVICPHSSSQDYPTKIALLVGVEVPLPSLPVSPTPKIISLRSTVPHLRPILAGLRPTWLGPAIPLPLDLPAWPEPLGQTQRPSRLDFDVVPPSGAVDRLVDCYALRWIRRFFTVFSENWHRDQSKVELVCWPLRAARTRGTRLCVIAFDGSHDFFPRSKHRLNSVKAKRRKFNVLSF